MSSAACATCGGNVDPTTGVCPQCATQINPRSGAPITETQIVAAPPGTDKPDTPEISGYRVINRLGEGGMGAVYLAEETTLGRRVAVKVISSRVAPDAQSKARFLREARMLATIEHAHVVRVYSFGEVEGRPYLAMEYVEGETLMERIARLGKLSVDDALRITRDVVDALDAAWEKHVIHRDIKPSNILIDRRNRVRVADFGLAKPMNLDDGHSALTLSGLMVGTPHYISPEQAQGKDVDFRSDFYSLGIMLFHMLTGERPFQGSTPVAIVAKHIHEPMPLATSRRADVPPAIERLIQWMTQKEPEKRPPSHQELLAALDGLITRTPTAPMPTFSTMVIPAAPKQDRLRLRIAAAGAIALLVIAASFFIWRARRDQAPFALAGPDSAFVVAVAPFYGPDDDSAKEGRVMAALIERAVADRLGKDNARVLGIEETKSAVRSHDEARELGTKLNASAVIWGEAFALRAETEIRPYVTLVETAKREETKDAPASDARLLADARMKTIENLSDAGAPAVKLEAEAPNQIELRKTSASGIGDLVLLLAGIHALETENKYDKALALFRQAPRSAETLRYEVQALLQADRRDEARATLEQAIALDAKNAASHALLGDLLMADRKMTEAIASYQRAASLGQPYTSTRGILHEGKLYLRETYQHKFQNDGSEGETMYLLALDPATQRVLERWGLPGQIRSLRTEGPTLVIGYDGGKEDVPVLGEIGLTNGRFDRPVWPTSNFLWRVRAMRGGRVLASNFLGEIDTIRVFGKPGGEFRLRKDAAPDLPATLPDLERALREAADRDPTDPWHLFFLAITLREQKRTADANAVLDELVRREHPHVPYYQFGWMLATLERLKYTDWMDRLYPKTLAARRRLPQTADFSTLIERLINQPFVRQAASNRDIDRGYTVLLRAREMGGITEAEDLVAAAWASHFESKGDHARAAHEREVVRRTNEHPFNYLGTVAKVDYAAAVTLAAFGAFVVLLLAVLVLAVRRARGAVSEPRRADTMWQKILSNIAGPVRTAVVASFFAAVVLATMWLYLIGALVTAVIVVVATVALALLVRRMRVAPKTLLASITRRERIVLIASYSLFIISAGALIYRLIDVGVVAGMPIGIMDAAGHPRVIDELESRLKTHPSDALEYVTAVANHYSGNHERAEALYRQVSDDYANKDANRAALQAGRMPAGSFTAEELYAGLRGSRWKRLREVLVEDSAPVISLFGLFFLMLALFAVRPREVTEPPLSKFAMVLVPGLYDLRRGSGLRALITLFLLLLTAAPIAALLSGTPLGFGFASTAMPNLSSAFPLPSSAADPFEDLKATMRMALPYARVFAGVVIAGGIAGLALHLLRIPVILRESE